MKIRCENCYKILKPNEEFCTSCGTHSDKIAHAMATGDYGPQTGDKIKINLIIYALTAFLTTGVASIIFAVVQDNASNNLTKSTYSLLISSIVSAIAIIAANISNLKDFFWNGNKNQFLGCFAIGTLFVAVCSLSSLLTPVTKYLPTPFTEYLLSGKARMFNGTSCNICIILVEFILIGVVEEILFRRLIIDWFDESTMLSDPLIILFTGLISMVLEFAWIMSPESLIMSFLMHMVLSGIYMNSNRSLALNIFFRILIVVTQIIIFLV